MMSGAIHSSSELRVRLAEKTDTQALVRLINAAQNNSSAASMSR